MRNGDVLGQSVSGMLRKLIFSLITESIDWDIEGFEKTAFVNTSSEENRGVKPFQATSISFQNQQTSINKTRGFNFKSLVIFLVLNWHFCFRGFISLEKKMEIDDFEKGDEFLSNVLECIPKLTDSVKIN